MFRKRISFTKGLHMHCFVQFPPGYRKMPLKFSESNPDLSSEQSISDKAVRQNQILKMQPQGSDGKISPKIKSANDSDTSPSSKMKKNKVFRRRLFKDEENISPVLGLRIVPAEKAERNPVEQKSDYLPQNKVSKSYGILASENEDNDLRQRNFGCKLCKNHFPDPLQLANHRCVRIQNVQYDCPECGKSFSCPANLASHRRWHKPKSSANKLDTVRETESKKSSVCASGEIKLKKDSERTLSSSSRNKNTKVKSHVNVHKETKRQCVPSSPSLKENSNEHLPKIVDTVSSKPIYPPAHRTISSDHRERGLGGLLALALAAEMHRRMPHPEKPMVAVPPRIEGKELKVKRSLSGNEKDVLKSLSKKSKLDEEFLKRYQDDSNNKQWLPPSPPRSDLSCSPNSAVSDEYREKGTEYGEVLTPEPRVSFDMFPIPNHGHPFPQKVHFVRPFEASPPIARGDIASQKFPEQRTLFYQEDPYQNRIHQVFAAKHSMPPMYSGITNIQSTEQTFQPSSYPSGSSPLSLHLPTTVHPSWGSSHRSPAVWNNPGYIPIYISNFPHAKS